MKVLLVDDVQLALDMLEKMLKTFPDVEIVGKYKDPRLALKDIREIKVDAIFLDMEMDGIHGLELANIITLHYSYVQIIFVTSHTQFALEAFEVNAVDYIVKPVKVERLSRAIERVRKRLLLSQHQNESEITPFFVNAMGSFQLFNMDKKIVRWRTRKVQELFVFLWHHRKKPVHKARIIEELWPNTDVIKAIQLLHTTIYQLRKNLKDAGVNKRKVINFVNDHYLLATEISSDVEELETIIEAGVLEDCIVDKALELYHGDYLAEEDYSWALHAREDLKSLFLHFLEKYITNQTANEQSLVVPKCLEKMVALDCYNEEYHFQLLDYYNKTKNYEQFLFHYKRCKSLFEEDLAVEIPEKIQQIYYRYKR